MDNNELDFSWATYKDPDKVVEIKKQPSSQTFQPSRQTFQQRPQSIRRPVASTRQVKKQGKRFQTKNKKVMITSMAMLTASIIVASMLQSNYKKVNSDKVLALANEVTEDVVADVTTLAYEEPSISSAVNENDRKVYESTNYTLPTQPSTTESTSEEVTEMPSIPDYKEVCINIPSEATKYLGEENYNKVINNFKDLIEKYSNMYGVDPNVIASIIMVECPDYDINNDRNYYKIGLGQFDGRYFDNETFSSHNFITGETDKYTVHVENLYQNPENQIKLLCMTIANSAKTYNYNVTAILENHNKGCGSVSNCLNKLKSDYGYNSKDEVLNNVDQNEIIENINKIGDPNYSYKVSYYINMCLEKNEFKNNSFITFVDSDTLENKTILFETSSIQRA